MSPIQDDPMDLEEGDAKDEGNGKGGNEGNNKGGKKTQMQLLEGGSKNKRDLKHVLHESLPLFVLDIRENCRLIERTVISKETRFVIRVMRGLFNMKKEITPQLLRRIVNGYYTHSKEAKEKLMEFIPKNSNVKDKWIVEIRKGSIIDLSLSL